MEPVIFCDFDGTITNLDTIVFLTENAGADPALREQTLPKIVAGEWTVYEAIEMQMKNLHLSWQEAVSLLTSKVHIDPSFEDFVKWAHGHQIPVKIVSSGMLPIIDLFIGHLNLEIYAHPVQVRRKGWRYTPDPEKMKVAVLQKARKDYKPLIYVGDGTSDVCALPFTDLVFAKRYLAEYCKEYEIPYFYFDNFTEVQSELCRGSII